VQFTGSAIAENIAEKYGSRKLGLDAPATIRGLPRRLAVVTR
jgi:hypothetical protein